MASAREMRLRIRSVKNISQVTRALQAVSASKVRRATQAVAATRPYAEKAWKVLIHLARQPGHEMLHPLLTIRPVNHIQAVMISSDRGLAGAYNTNIARFTLLKFNQSPAPVSYIAVGRKGRDLLFRRRMDVTAEFSNLPSPPTFVDISAIGRLLYDDFLQGKVDEVYLVYTRFRNMITQEPVCMKLLPLDVTQDIKKKETVPAEASHSVFTYEPDAHELLDQIIQRFTAMQVYQAILESQASEHAARMIAMRNATDNARDLTSILQLEYNKVRQQSITNDLLDIAGGAESLAKAAMNVQ